MRASSIVLALALPMIALPGLARAENWTGDLRCGEVPNLVGPLKTEMTVEQSGATFSYRREVRTQGGGFSGTVESGTGTLTGDQVVLRGSWATRTASYQAVYQGKLAGGKMELRGGQEWTYANSGGPVHRPCRATLTLAR